MEHEQKEATTESFANNYLPNAVTSYTPLSTYLRCNFSDLELGRFMVIQRRSHSEGHSAKCQSKARWALVLPMTTSNVMSLTRSLAVFGVFDAKMV